MLNDGFQYLEQRDAQGNITHEGVANKDSAFVTDDNSGMYDIFAENFRVLKDSLDEAKDTSDVEQIKSDIKAMYDDMRSNANFGETTAKAQAEKALQQAIDAAESAAEAKNSADSAKATATELESTIAEIKSYITEAQSLVESNKDLEKNIADNAQIATNKSKEASTSASNAATSESNAKTSETHAKTSETNAKTSEMNASTSEANAKKHATNASTSEANAKTSETNTKTSETNAKTSETNAKLSESNAYSSMSSAHIYAQDSSDFADASKKSATNAATSEKNAKTSETNSATSASNSAKSASSSATSATNAASSADTAKKWAESADSPNNVDDPSSATGKTQSARSWAINAKTQYTNAANSATNAKTSETNAATSKTNAANSASNAATSANNAKNYMQQAQTALSSVKAVQSLIDVSKQSVEKCLADVEAVKDSISKMFTYQGSVDNFFDLPSSPQVGWVYNIVNEDKTNKINAGENVVWNGNAWDNLGSFVDMSLYAELGKDVKFNKVTGSFVGNLSGNAATATKATNADHATTADSATKATNADKATHATSADTATTADNANKLGGYGINLNGMSGQYNTIPLIRGDGVMEVGKYIDFHSKNNDGKDYSSRFTANDNGTVTVGNINGTLNGKATSAGSADSATKATNDSAGNNINGTYIKGISASGRTITFTKGNGTTGTITTQDTTYGVSTQSANGLMSASDKKKLDGIATGANHINVDSAMSATSTNPVQNKVINSALAGKSNTSHNHDGRYAITYRGDFSTNGKYLKLGIATLKQEGSFLYIKVFTGNGYNGNLAQHRQFDIQLRASNGAVPSGQKYAGFAGFVESHYGTIGVHICQTSNTTFEVWLDKTSFMGASFYTAQVSGNSSWSNAQHEQDALPANTILLPNKQIAFKDDIHNVSVDGSLSTSSTNPVQNKVVTNALNGKANSSHTHAEITNTGGRVSSANVEHADGKLRYMLATANMTTGKPPIGDSPIIDLSWDNGNHWESQIAVGLHEAGQLAVRSQNGGTWTGWNKVYDTGHKPSKTDVGLGNVDNTADSAKSVKYATSAGSATNSTNANTATKVKNALTLAGGVSGSYDGSVAKTFTLPNVYIGDYSPNGFTVQLLVKRLINKGAVLGSANIEKTTTPFKPPSGNAWYNFIYTPHRNGVGSDNMNYGTLLLFPMQEDSTSYILRIAANATIASCKPIITEHQSLANYPTKTGSGASGTWGISVAGNANTASYPSGFASRSGGQGWGNQTGTFITDWHTSKGGDIAFRDNNGEINVIIDGVFYQREGNKVVIDESTVNNYAPTKTGGGASGTWNININGNATKWGNITQDLLTVNNTDTWIPVVRDGKLQHTVKGAANGLASLDGSGKVPASQLSVDMLSLAGRTTPKTITPIFDRETLIKNANDSDANIKTQLSYINKQRNWSQSIWRTDTGIYAYGGDANIKQRDKKDRGRGTIFLKQPFTNFDKLMFVICNDNGDRIRCQVIDSWFLYFMMNHYSHYTFSDGTVGHWNVLGTDAGRKGTTAWSNYASSTTTELVTFTDDGQNAGIIEIYGIKY